MQPPKVLPPHYFVLSIVLMLLLDLFWPLPLVSGWLQAAGLLPMAAGVLLAVRAAAQFKAADTNIIPLTLSTTLVDNGVFGLSRNPMYLGMLMFLAGLAWLLGSIPAAAVLPVFYLIIRLGFVAREEQLMEATFGAQYLDYKNRVRRWL